MLQRKLELHREQLKSIVTSITSRTVCAYLLSGNHQLWTDSGIFQGSTRVWGLDYLWTG